MKASEMKIFVLCLSFISFLFLFQGIQPAFSADDGAQSNQDSQQQEENEEAIEKKMHQRLLISFKENCNQTEASAKILSTILRGEVKDKRNSDYKQ